MDKDYFQQDFSRLIWRQNYQYRNEANWSVTSERVADALAEPEGDEKSYFQPIFEELLREKRFLPGGRIIANAGTDWGRATLINCYVSGPQKPDVDSMEEINEEVGRCMKILASEGGYGVNANFLRPRGAVIRGTGARTPGAVEMLNIWDQTAETLTKGPEEEAERDDVKEKVRKGAMMVTMSLWHPDAVEFIQAKSEAGRLAHFNMSVLANDNFMTAVKNGEQWQLRYPDFEAAPEKYEAEWDGRIRKWEESGGPVKVYDTVSARSLWNMVMESTYRNNEPGVQFIDTVNRRNPLYYTEFILGSNPCVPKDTWVMTESGPAQAGDLMDSGFDSVVDGDSYESIPFFETGRKEVVTLKTDRGYRLRATPDHEIMTPSGDWVEAQDLEGREIRLNNHRDLSGWDGEGTYNEGYTCGLYVGDGTHNGHKCVLSVWNNDGSSSVRNRIASFVESKIDTRSDFKGWKFLDERNEYRMSPIGLTAVIERFGLTEKEIKPEAEETSSEFYEGFLRGLFDADGHVEGSPEDGASVRLSQSDRDLLVTVQRMLQRLGIMSTIYESHDAGETEMPDGNGGTDTYNTKKQWRLVISKDNLEFFQRRVGFQNSRKSIQLDQLLSSYDKGPYGEDFTARVQSVEADTEEVVVDTTVEDVHAFDANGIYVSNCGEQFLPPGGSCNLGNVVLPSYLKRRDGSFSFDWDQFEEDVKYGVRMLDNVNDLSYFPLNIQVQQAQNKRRIGLGHMGFGSALLMLGIPYGSKESVLMARRVQKTLVNEAYRASAHIAAEKGAFEKYDSGKYLDGDMVKRLDADVRRLIGQHGVRNSHCTSIQPTGNTSQLADVVSGGLEPVFSFQQQRTAEMPHLPSGLVKPTSMPEEEHETVKTENGSKWVAEKQHREIVWRCTEEGYQDWQVHPTRGITKDFVIEDYGVHKLKQHGEWEPNASWAVKTTDLTVEDHISVMTPFAEYIDSAMSKTVNVPNGYDFEDFKGLYMDAWETGLIKGLTTYRAGTMSAVLEDVDNDEDEETDCPECGTSLVHDEGCESCPNCGWEKCSI